MMEQEDLTFRITKNSDKDIGLSMENLPENISPKKILAKMLLKYEVVDPSKAEKISADIFASARKWTNQLEPTRAKDIAIWLNSKIKDKKINKENLAKKILDDYERALTQSYKGYTFPCDGIIQLVITAVKKFQEQNPPGSSMFIDDSSSRFFVEAFMLYGQCQEAIKIYRAVRCTLPESKYTDSFSLFGKTKPVATFKQLLEERKELFKLYETKIVEVKLPQPSKSETKITKEQYLVELNNKISDPIRPLNETDWNLIKQMAEEGRGVFQAFLGENYYTGQKGLPQDFEQAFYWLKQTAAQAQPRAQCYLGLCYLEGHGVPKNVKEAINWFEKASNQGDVLALFTLGMCYSEGIEIPKDNIKAFSLLEKAATTGNPEAQLLVALRYKEGEGVLQDDKQAFFWLQKAADQGEHNAQSALGLYYYQGEGCSIDLKLAAHWFQKAADQGNMRAQRDLAMCYSKGHGVTKDFKQAAHWFQKAADQEDISAKFFLGLCYFEGNGVAKDSRRALSLFETAANGGNTTAEFMIGKCYQEDNGILQNNEQAVLWFQKSANHENDEAQFALGLCYLQGTGVSPDVDEGIKWVQKSAEQGNSNAQQFLTTLAEYLNETSETQEKSKESKKPSQFGPTSPALHKMPSVKSPNSQEGENESKQEDFDAPQP